MKDQVLRILRMVQEGRLSPDDALDLMDAFVDFESSRTEQPAEQPKAQQEPEPKSQPQDPFRRFVDSIDNLTKESLSNIKWNEIAESIRDAARKGAESVREKVEHLSKRDLIGLFWTNDEAANVTLPLKISQGDTLRMSVGKGDIKITGGSSDPKLTADVRVRGKTKEEAKERARTWTPVLDVQEGLVTIRTNGELSCENYEIEVPSGVSVELELSSGDVEIRATGGGVRAASQHGDLFCEGARGMIEIKTSAGDVKLRDAQASQIQVEVQHGDIRIERSKGPMKLRAASGDIAAKDVEGNTLSLETVDGDIDLEVSAPFDGSMNIRTVHGDVLVDLAGGSNCNVALNSINGSVSCSAPLDEMRRSEERITGRLGAGEGTIDISAVSGDVSFNLRDSS